jgi:hypothetical protein
MNIDFSYAFDTINRDVIRNRLIHYNDPDKQVKLIKLTMQENKMKVKINGNYTEWFKTKTGDRQGDTFLAILSSTILDIVNRNLHLRENIPTRLTLCRSYLNPYCLGRKTAFFSVGI